MHRRTAARPSTASHASALRQAWRLPAVAMALALALTACTDSAADAPAATPVADSTVSPLVDGQIDGVEEDPERATTFRAAAEQTRAEAAEQGATQEQLAIIDAAVEDGLMSMERLLEARHAYAQCLDSMGFSLLDQGVQMDGGVAYPMYATQTSADYDPESSSAEDNLEMACMDQHLMFVDMLYQTQPLATQAHDAHFASKLPEVILCLQDAGLAVDDAATVDEVKAILMSELQ